MKQYYLTYPAIIIIFLQSGDKYYLVIDKKDTDFYGDKCNKIGAQYPALYTRESRCHRRATT